MKKWIALCLAAALGWSLLGGCGKKDESKYLKLQAADGLQIVSGDELEDFQRDDRWAYWEAVLEEAAAVLAGQLDCTEEEAMDTLLDGGYTIRTAFEPAAFSALEAAFEELGGGMEGGIALTDLEGNLAALYSSSDGTNYATAPTAPYSTIKPLSVYAQALERGIIRWTSFYEDSPYKQIPGEDGTPVDWPSNSADTYSYEDVTVAEAIRESLNTVAIKCLAEVGVENSVAFLQEKLGIDLSIEQNTAAIYGWDEVIGNIAMGYLEGGVTPVDMAGYYQMFANGGKYEAPRAVLQIWDAAGTAVYTRTYAPEQIISPTTAQLMNRLLQEVTAPGGTGVDAACPDVQTAGKTGTGEGNSGNWFVGLTPGYSCAVWHGKAASNMAPEIFRIVMTQLYTAQPKANRNFITHSNLQELVCCSESGEKVSSGCAIIEIGYFALDQTVPVCRRHG